ncbi:MAG: hypothetical protein AB8G99_07595 [Planctomycetaceae bacterium]
MAFTLDELYNMQDHNGEPEPTNDNDAHFEAETAVEVQDVAEDAGLTDAQSPSIEPSGGSPSNTIENELQELRAEVSILHERLAAAKQREGQGDPFQEEMIELLRSEVTQLQAELAAKDLLQAEAPSDAVTTFAATDVDSAELDKLCSRLEELLRELDEKDEQVSVLQSHLQAAEDANHAEQNERYQLESWLEEIESRITRTSRDHEAQLSELQMRLTQARAERRQAETSAGETNTDTRIEALQRVVTEVREDKESLQANLDEAQATIRNLEAAVEGAKEDASREESVQLCQERADIARQRFELEKTKREMEEQRAVEGSDLRIRALRDHLKEVQATEAVEKQEAFENSLAGRVSRLWKRLDSR